MKFNYDWQYSVFNIYNFNKKGKLDGYFDFIKENHNIIEGDICEIGVYQGHSLLATALLLKELGSDKKVYGFDSFSGFPSYHKYDSLSYFENLHDEGMITSEHYRQVKLNLQYKELLTSKISNPSTISSSGDFSNTSIKQLQKKIDFLSLDNIELIDGDYISTMSKDEDKSTYNFFSVLMDCDLYESHKIALPFTWDRMSPGAFMFLDEYYSLKFPGARIAINEFFKNKFSKPKVFDLYDGEFERWYIKKLDLK
jgi:hypothetical protein